MWCNTAIYFQISFSAYIYIYIYKPHKNYPGYLISASCNAYTNNLASLTVHELRKVNLPYNLKDTNNFLQKIDNVNKSCIFSSINDYIYSRVIYIYVRSRAKYLKFRTTTSKINTLRKPLMQQKYYFVHEM